MPYFHRSVIDTEQSNYLYLKAYKINSYKPKKYNSVIVKYENRKKDHLKNHNSVAEFIR